MYKHSHIQIPTLLDTLSHICTHTNTNTITHTYKHSYIQIPTHLDTLSHICTHTNTITPRHTLTHTYTCVCMQIPTLSHIPTHTPIYTPFFTHSHHAPSRPIQYPFTTHSMLYYWPIVPHPGIIFIIQAYSMSHSILIPFMIFTYLFYFHFIALIYGDAVCGMTGHRVVFKPVANVKVIHESCIQAYSMSHCNDNV